MMVQMRNPSENCADEGAVEVLPLAIDRREE